MNVRSRQEIRKQVEERIIQVLADAEASGLQPHEATKLVEQKFAGTPDMVIIKAQVEFNRRKEEAWWQTVENTIEGELIERAIRQATA